MDRTSEIETTLNRLHIEYKLVGNNFMISCPFHSDESPSFGIRIDGVWNCFSCNESGDWKKLSDILGFATKKFTLIEMVRDKLKDREETSKMLISTELPDDFITYGNNPPMNVIDRMPMDIIEKYGIGDAKYTFARYFIIPIEIKGYRSYTCRHLSRKPIRGEKRWRFAKGFHKVIFPEPQKEVIITEGILDAFAIEAFGFASSTCFGHAISDSQLSQLISRNVEKIVILFDDYEDHYSVSIRRTFKVLQQFFEVSIMKLGRDADEVNKNEFVKAYDERICLSEEMEKMVVLEFNERIKESLYGYG